MTDRVGPERRAIERLQDDVAESESRIEDLERALEDSQRVCERYREALVYLRNSVNAHGGVSVERINRAVEEAIWTKTEDVTS